CWTVQCTSQPLFPIPSIDVNGPPQLGTSYGVTLADGLPSSVAVLVTGSSSPSPVTLPGTACDLYVSPDITDAELLSATGACSHTIPVPSSTNFLGVNLYHQWAVLDPAANQLGIVMSNAGAATFGF
ncbi:MAG: hypothetical protein KDC98_03295, partial [Planctomycetes bacterium]|nr:hypothetical protein [Planctomycetota bacterium]